MVSNYTEVEEDVACKIVGYINKEKLKSGAPLPSIRVLSKVLNTNPNAVRDGLLRAQAIGLVKIQPRSGTFVQSLNFDSFADAFKETIATVLLQEEKNLLSLIEARKLIEIELAGRAAAQCHEQDMLPLYNALETMDECRNNQEEFIHADEEFHLNIAKIAGNQILVVFLQALLTILRPYRMTLVRAPKEMGYIDKVHWEIYQSIIKEDVENARAKMNEHLNYQRQQLVDKITTVTEESSDAGKNEISTKEAGQNEPKRR